MSQHTIAQVGPSNQWQSQQGGAFVDYQLRFAGVEKVAILTQKPETAPPQPGQTIDVDLLPHPKFQDKLKAKRIQQQRPQSGGQRPDDPETRKSIERQVALKAAVEYEARKDAAAAQNGGALSSPLDVTVTAQVFADWLAQS